MEGLARLENGDDLQRETIRKGVRAHPCIDGRISEISEIIIYHLWSQA
jgi:hypothetical protein